MQDFEIKTHDNLFKGAQFPYHLDGYIIDIKNSFLFSIKLELVDNYN